MDIVYFKFYITLIILHLSCRRRSRFWHAPLCMHSATSHQQPRF